MSSIAYTEWLEREFEEACDENEGLRAKLSTLRLYRHLYDKERALARKEGELLKVERAWTEKLERVLATIIVESEFDSIDIRKYAEKVLESKPKGLR